MTTSPLFPSHSAPADFAFCDYIIRQSLSCDRVVYRADELMAYKVLNLTGSTGGVVQTSKSTRAKILEKRKLTHDGG